MINNKIVPYKYKWRTLVIVILISLIILGPTLSPLLTSSLIKHPFDNSARLSFHFFCALLFGFYGLQITINDKITFTRLGLTVVILLLYICLTNLFFRSHYRIDKIIDSICQLGLFFVVYNALSLKLITVRDFIYLFVSAALVTLSLALIIGIAQIIKILPSNNLYFSFTGTFNNPAKFALYLSSIFPVTYTTIFYFPKGYRYHRIFLSSAIIISLGILVIIAISATRAAFIGVIISIAFISALKFPKSARIISVVFIGLILVLIILSLTNFKSNSAIGRLTIWKISCKMIDDNPMFGIGLGNFESQYNHCQSTYFYNNQSKHEEIKLADTVRYAYNDFLERFIEQGIMGSLVFIFLLCSIFKNLFSLRLYKGESLFLLTSSIGIIISILSSGLFSYTYNILPNQNLFYIGIALVNFVGAQRNLSLKTFIVARYLFSTLKIVLLTFSVSLLWYSVKQTYAYVNWANPSMYVLEYEEMEHLSKSLNDDPIFNLEYSTALIEAGRYKEVIELLANSPTVSPQAYTNLGNAYYALKRIKDAEASFIIAMYMVPNRFESKKALMDFYYQNNDTLKCKTIASLILKSPIKIPSTKVAKIKREAEYLIACLQNNSL